MALGLAEAHEHPVADHEAGRRVLVGVAGGNVGFPPGEVLAVEERRDVAGHEGRGCGFLREDGAGGERGEERRAGV